MGSTWNSVVIHVVGRGRGGKDVGKIMSSTHVFQHFVADLQILGLEKVFKRLLFLARETH